MKTTTHQLEKFMKRVIAAATTMLLTFAGLVAMSAPANANPTSLADVYSYEGGTITTYVGEPVNWDWMSCGGQDASQLWFDSGTLPTGLSWDNGVDYTSTPTGAVTGTPTEVGSWTLSGLHCNYSIGPRSDNVGGGSWNNGHVTVQVVLPPSPTPIITITNYANANCDYEIDVRLPEAYAPGSAKLSLTNGTSTGEYILYDFLAINANNAIGGSLFDNSVIAQYAHTVVTEPTFQCGDTITATISYTAVGKAEASASATETINQPPSPAPSITVTNVDDNQCNVSIRGLIGVAPKSGTAKLVISTDASEVTVTLVDYTPQYEYNLNLSMYGLEAALTASPLVASTALTRGIRYPGCEQTMDFTLSYVQEGHAKASASQTGLAVSRLGDVPGVTLAVTPRDNDLCELDITGTFATQELANSVKLSIESQNESREITLINYMPGQQISLTWSPDNADSTNDPHVGSNTGAGPGHMHCGEPLGFTLSYFDLVDDSYYSSQTINLTPTYPPEMPKYLTLTSLNDEYCNIRVTAAAPFMADQGSVHLTFAKNEGETVNYQLRDYYPGELIDFTISTTDWRFDLNHNVVSKVRTNDYSPKCGEYVSAQLSWSFMDNWMNSEFQTVYASQSFPWPTTSVTPVGGQNCLVAVTVLIPRPGNEVNELRVGDEGGYVVLQLKDIPVTPFTVLVPLSDMASTRDSHILGTPVVLGTYHCGSTVSAQVSTKNEGESVFDSMPPLDPPTSYSVCNLGRFHQNGNCVPAPIGSFVNTLDANEATSCPREFTTAFTGSTSPNDCYKPVAQIVKGLKAPKAMKFKAAIGLPVLTNSGGYARVTAAGPCTVEIVQAGGKVAGKKVKVQTAAIKAGTAAGNCVLTFEGVGSMPFSALSQTVTIKVNKKGK